MVKKCKQCGKEFNLSDAEIGFYKSKGLEIPKRCKACREANKAKDGGSNGGGSNGGGSNGRGSNGDNGIILKRVIVAGIFFAVMFILGTTIYRFYSNKDENGADVQDNQYVSQETFDRLVSDTLPDEIIDKISEGDSEDAAGDSEGVPDNGAEVESGDVAGNDTGSGAGDAAGNDTGSGAGDTTGNDTGSGAGDTTGNDTGSGAGDAAGNNSEGDSQVTVEVSYYFRSSKLREEHFQKHGIDMGFATAQDYEKAASNVINNPDALHKLEAEDGDGVYYLEATNEFVILSTDGYIRTYFCPSRGKDYYDSQ